MFDFEKIERKQKRNKIKRNNKQKEKNEEK